MFLLYKGMPLYQAIVPFLHFGAKSPDKGKKLPHNFEAYLYSIFIL